MAGEHEDGTTDIEVAVAGSGVGGLTAAIAAAAAGARVEIFEKAAGTGGTTRKSAAWFWVCNNRLMRDAGLSDPREQALQYMARLARPARFNRDDPTLGLADWEYEGLATFYDHGARVLTELEALGGLVVGGNLEFPDYYAQLPENAAPVGRTLWPARSGGSQIGGQYLVDDLLALATRLGVRVHTGRQIDGTELDANGNLCAVTATHLDGMRSRVETRAAIFGTGGFTHDPELRQQFLTGPYVGGCAATTNTGDFVRIAQRLGASMGNLQYAWSAPIVIERVMREPANVAGSFAVAGDALVFVNRAGDRFVNEKAPYNEICLKQFDWDPKTAAYPNLPLIAIWDRLVAERFAGSDFGNPIPPPGVDGYWVVSADTVNGLVEPLTERLSKVAHLTGNAALTADFGAHLKQSVDQFNQYAAAGVDEQFGRGQTPIELAGVTLMGASTGANPTMRPFDSEGPYYATILGPGTLDTKGGPRVDTSGRLLTVDGRPVPGVYGVGNAVASPTGQGYFGGGGTIGPILCFSYLAGQHAAAHAVNPL